MGLEIVAVGLILAMRLFPETPFARSVHLHLVERPMAWLSKLERHQLVFFLIAVAMLLAAGEIIAIVGSADVALTLAWDLSLYFDAVAVAAVVAAARQIRIAVRLARARLGALPAVPRMMRRSAREVRPHRRPSAPTSANDDDPAVAVAA